MLTYHILANRRVIGPVGLLDWVDYHDKGETVVAVDVITEDVTVSTRFYGCDHGYGPVLFETRVHGGPHASAVWHTKTWDHAEERHRLVVTAMDLGGELPSGRYQ